MTRRLFQNRLNRFRAEQDPRGVGPALDAIHVNSESSNFPPEALLQHAEFLRRLARGLLLDDGLAEDALQETHLAALRKPPRARGSLRQWAATTTRRFALRQLNRNRHRRDREEIVALGRTEAHLPGDSSASSLRAVTSAVMHLEQPYRSVILARYYEDLGPTEIAQREGVPLATVNTRLQRGLKRLREALRDEYGERQWGLWLVPFLDSESIAHLGSASGVHTAQVSWLPRLLSMNLPVKISVSVVVVGLMLYGFAQLQTPAPTAPIESFGTSSTGPDTKTAAIKGDPNISELDRAPVAAAKAPQAMDNAAPPIPPTASGNFKLTALWDSDESPAQGRGFKVLAWDSKAPERSQWHVETNAEGEAHLEALPLGTLLVYGNLSGGGRVEILPGETAELVCRLPAGIELKGRVLDPDGSPVPDATIWISDYGNDEYGCVAAITDRRGRYAIEGVSGGREMGAYCKGFSPSELHYIEAPEGSTIERDLVLKAGGASVSGAIFDPSGEPVAEAWVRAVSKGDSLDGLAPSRPQLDARSDSEGLFRLDGIPPGPIEVQVRTHDFALLRHGLELRADDHQELYLTLEARAEIFGQVLDGDGTPRAGVDLRFGDHGSFSGARARSDETGHYRMSPLPAGPVEVIAKSDDGGSATLSTTLIGGTRFEWNPILDEGLVLVGTVVDQDGKPLVGWQIDAVCHTPRPGTRVLWGRYLQTDANGRFRLVDCPEDPLQIHIRRSPSDLVTIRKLADVDPRGPDLWIEILAEELPSATLRGKVLGADGKGCQVRLIARRGDSHYAYQATSAEDTGRFEFETMRAGKYVLTLESGSGFSLRLPDVHLGLNEVVELETIRLPVTAGIDLWTDGQRGFGPYTEISVRALDSGSGAPSISLPSFHNSSDLAQAQLQAGKYRLLASGPNVAPNAIYFEALAGVRTNIELESRPGVLCEWICEFPRALEIEDLIFVSVFNQSGELHCRWLENAANTEQHRFHRRLTPGIYQLEFKAVHNKYQGTCEIQVQDLADNADPSAFQFQLEFE